MPVFQNWLSYAIAVSAGILSVVPPTVAMDADIAIKIADSWHLERQLLIRADGDAQLAVVVLESAERCAASFPELFVKGRALSCTRPRSDGWSWYVLEPVAKDYDNVAGCVPITEGCVQPVSYRSRELAALRGREEVTAAELSKLLGLGTHWLRVTPSGAISASDLIETKGRPTSFELVVRRDDSYVGYLTERLGIPFVYLPALTPLGEHQTDAGLGADCVALVIYGQRRLGRRVPYMAPSALKRYTALVAREAAGEQPVAVGDILHFGFQTAVVSVDRNRMGQLDDEDLVIHTYHTRAEELPFSSLPYAHTPFEVRRWPEVW